MLYRSNKDLVNSLIKDGYLKSPLLIEAFLKIDRKNFVRKEDKEVAYLNAPLSIGFGQTISQPLTVAFMLEHLEPKTGEFILDIGSGSGWTASLLAYCVKPKGKVFALERIKELCEFGKNNAKKYNFVKSGLIEFFCQDGSKGLSEISKKIGGFSKILISASAPKIYQEWIDQLKDKGKIVVPVRDSIVVLKKENNKISTRRFYGFSFVPLISA